MGVLEFYSEHESTYPAGEIYTNTGNSVKRWIW